MLKKGRFSMTASIILRQALSVLLILTIAACGGSPTNGDQNTGPIQNDPNDQSAGNGTSFGLDIPTFRDILLVYRIDYSTLIVSIDQDPVMIFDDGSATLDLTGVLSDGIESSKQNEPIKWGRWSGDAMANNFELGLGTRPLTEVLTATLYNLCMAMALCVAIYLVCTAIQPSRDLLFQ